MAHATSTVALPITIHRGAHPRPVAEVIPFLCFTVFPEHRRLNKCTGVQFPRWRPVMLKAYERDLMSRDALVASVRGRFNYVRLASTHGLGTSLLAEPLLKLPELQACISHHRS